METTFLHKKPQASFSRAPLVEVLMGIQFADAIDYKMLDLADFWEKVDKKKFPYVTEYPPLEPYPYSNTDTVKLSYLPDIRRIRFESENQDQLIQLQQDRFIYSWLKPSTDLKDQNYYLGYEYVKKEFHSNYSKLVEFTGAINIEKPSPSYLELTYVNFLDLPEGGLKNLDEVIRGMNFVKAKTLSTPDSLDLKWTFDISDVPLSLEIYLFTEQSVYDGKIGLQYELTAHGPFNNLSEEDMLKWFDDAHVWIAHYFLETTTDLIHKTWGIR